MIFHMALCACQSCSIHVFKVLTQSIVHIAVSHCQLTGGICVAVITADRLVDLLHQICKCHGVNGIAHFIYHIGELGSLTGPAAGQRVGADTLSGHDILQIEAMTAGTLVISGEAIGLIQGFQHGIVFQIIGSFIVFAVLCPACILIRVAQLPIRSVFDAYAGTGFNLIRDFLNQYAGTTELAGVDITVIKGVYNGILDCSRCNGGTGDCINLQALCLENVDGQLIDGEGTDTFCFTVIDNVDLVNGVIGHDNFNCQIIVASGGCTDEGECLGRHILILHTCGGRHESHDNITHHDHQQNDTAADAEDVISLFLPFQSFRLGKTGSIFYGFSHFFLLVTDSFDMHASPLDSEHLEFFLVFGTWAVERLFFLREDGFSCT